MYMEMGVYRHQWSMTTRLISLILAHPAAGTFSIGKLTIGTTIVAIKANNDTYCLQKRIENLQLVTVF